MSAPATPSGIVSPSDRGGIYVASKAVAHGPMWRARRAAGWPIISTWIDESDEGATLDWPDLWGRCLAEAARADVLIAYREPGEILKGAFIEIGVALGLGKPVIAVGLEEYSISKSGRLILVEDLDAAFARAKEEMRGAAEMAALCNRTFLPRTIW